MNGRRKKGNNVLKYELIENNKDIVAYRYFPDGGSASGTLTVNKETVKIVKQELAPDDDFRIYLLKLYKRIKEFIHADKFNESGMIAWY